MSRVLYLVHSLPPEEYSGTPLVAQGYAANAAAHGWDATVVHASNEARSWGKVGVSRDPGENFARVRVPPTVYANWTLEAASARDDLDAGPSKAFREILEEVRPDVLHVVDNVSLPLSWPEEASRRGIPVLRTVSCLEDLCALISPVSPESGPSGFCEAPITPEHCHRCMVATQPDLWGWQSSGLQPMGRALMEQRRRRVNALLQRKRERATLQFHSVFDRVLFSNRGLRDYFEETLPLDEDRVRVVAMGLETSRFQRPDDPRAATERPLVFALAGMLEAPKGSTIVAEAFCGRELLGRDDYRLILLGEGGDPNITKLVESNRCVSRLGAYRSDDLPALLSEADVGLSPSLFETFHRVTREYLLCGLPVVANPTFGVREVVSDRYNGLVYHGTDPQSLSNAALELIEDRSLVEKLSVGAIATPVRSVQDEVAELIGLYEELAA